MPNKPVGSVKRHRGKWVARVSFTEPITGKRREWRRTGRENTRASTAETRDELLRRLSRGEFAAPPVNDVAPVESSFAAIADKYLDACVREPVYENGIKVSGMKDHAGVRSMITKIFVPALGSRPIEAISHAELRSFRDQRLNAPKLRGGRKIVKTKGRRSIARVNREMATLRAIFNYAIDDKALKSNPMATRRGNSLVLLKAEKARDRILTLDEERALLAEYEKAETKRSRDYFIVALDTGLRRSEMFQLEVRDVDFAAAVVRLRWQTTKTKRPRIVPMSSRVREILKRRTARRSPGALIFSDLSQTIVRKDFRIVTTAAKVKNFRMHDCRATVATRLQQRGLSEHAIALMTGHRFNRESGEAPTLRKHYLRLDDAAIAQAGTLLDGLAMPN